MDYHKMVETLAWPAVVVIGMLIFRGPLSELIRKLKKANAKSGELEFGQELKEVEAEAEIAKLPRVEPPMTQGGKAETVQEKVERISQISPNAAVLEAWREVDAVVDDLMADRPVAVLTPRPIRPTESLRFMSVLASEGKIDANSYSIYRKLRDMRNEASHNHAFQITRDDAIEYGQLASRLSAKLRELLPKQPT